MARALVEYSPETEAFAPGRDEVGAPESAAEAGTAGALSQAGEMELAAALLEVTSDAELDSFLGQVLRRAERDAGNSISPSTTEALRGLLKSVAKRVLPLIGPGAAGVVEGISRASLAASPAQQAGELFGLELEGLSPEDQEFETARAFVRFAEAATKNAAGAPTSASPRAVAQTAAIRAARDHAPGLLSSTARAPAGGAHSSPLPGRVGRWVRRGRNIFIVNC